MIIVGIYNIDSSSVTQQFYYFDEAHGDGVFVVDDQCTYVAHEGANQQFEQKKIDTVFRGLIVWNMHGGSKYYYYLLR